MEDIRFAIFNQAFVEGYLAGQMFDIPDKALLRKVEMIKKTLVKVGKFGFLPREKKDITKPHRNPSQNQRNSGQDGPGAG